MTLTPLDKIITFETQFKQIVWGGSRISELKGENIPSSKIGESWEISSVRGNESVIADGNNKGKTINQLADEYGEELLGKKVIKNYGKTFPLLIKLIDALDVLSLQVHPDDELALRRHNSRGKTEMWYVIDAKPDAKIYCGLAAPFSPDDLDKRIHDNTIMDVVKCYHSQAGQFYYIPAGTLHAIGAGNLIAEIQESSDITYRVYDHNRVGIDGQPRQLHIEESRDAIDYSYPNTAEPTAESFDATRPKAVTCDYFTVDYLKLDGDTVAVETTGESFIVILVTDGNIEIDADDTHRNITAGHTVMIPASVKNLKLTGSGKALSVYI